MSVMAWALVGTDNIVLTVQIASLEWIDANPEPPNVWRDAAEGTLGYAGVGFTYDEETGWYIPPEPTGEGDWYFDRDPEVWRWIDRDAPPPDTPGS